MIGQAVFSIVVLLIGYTLDPSLLLLWIALATSVWLPAGLIFFSLVLGLAYLITL